MSAFDGADIFRRLAHGLMGTGVEPGIPTAHFFDVQIVIFQIHLVDVCDFQLATRRRRDIGGDVEHPIVIKIQAGNSPVRGWVFRFLNNFGGLALVIEGHHTVAFGVADIIAENRRPAGTRRRPRQKFGERVTEENIVPKHQCAGIVADEIGANDKGLGEALRFRLHGEGNGHAPLAAVAQQPFKRLAILWGGDDQNIADAGKQ